MPLLASLVGVLATYAAVSVVVGAVGLIVVLCRRSDAREAAPGEREYTVQYDPLGAAAALHVHAATDAQALDRAANHPNLAYPAAVYQGTRRVGWVTPPHTPVLRGAAPPAPEPGGGGPLTLYAVVYPNGLRKEVVGRSDADALAAVAADAGLRHDVAVYAGRRWVGTVAAASGAPVVVASPLPARLDAAPSGAV